ncbi:MAG: UDP-N-acetylglucosamine 2-epimerase [Rhodospirillales bacterium]
MSERKICVITGTRAEYGLLYWLMKEIEADPVLKLQLIVTGAHLEARFGDTVDVIEADGFRIDARVPLDLSDDTPTVITAATGRALSGIGAQLADLQPDIVVLLGDRYEILAAATAAMLHRIPIAHIHGGEVTEGAIDDSMRHAISKISRWHFVAAEPYRQRLVQMGEQPDSVVTVGAPGLDHLERTTLLDADETASVLGIGADQPYFLITHHPTTLGAENPSDEINALLSALEGFREYAYIFTGVNADAGNEQISGAIQRFVASRVGRARLFPSLGQQRYLSAMKYCSAVIGNSSSGIIEAPALDVPTVNIGMRQKGRLRAASVLDCAPDIASIQAAIGTVIDPAFMSSRSDMVPPYGVPGASTRIKNALSSCRIDTDQRKQFYDLPSFREAS